MLWKETEGDICASCCLLEMGFRDPADEADFEGDVGAALEGELDEPDGVVGGNNGASSKAPPK